MRARARLIVAVASLLACAAACGSAPAIAPDASAPEAGVCPEDLPAACPATAPRYQAEIALILASKCASCHGAGGTASSRFDTSSYDRVYSARATALSQIYDCRMPPANAVALSPGERAALLTWFVCHAPNN